MIVKKHSKFNRTHLARKFYNQGFTKGVEVGVYYGLYSKVLCQENPNLELKSIDPYRETRQNFPPNPNGYENIYKHAKKILKPYNCQIIRKLSIEASAMFKPESIDFVYIDGSHKFDYVMSDLIVWGWKVRKGGIISGHDYRADRFDCDVPSAVNYYAHNHCVYKINITDEALPSWWFRKKW